MFQIHLKRFDPVLVFAAQELKKYLKMMMPEGGEADILLEPCAKDGFQLGLLEDFSLPTDEVEDPLLDDVVHIDTNENGGILAGSNPRSVLFAVYRYLRLNGCRWLYPGVDGDFVPEKRIEPQKYHKKADHRFRGHCNEGAESQECMLETIAFYAKQELNVYMLEFPIPYGYYSHYYNHHGNEANRKPEGLSARQVVQWKRECEAHIARRGLMFHDMGHGWTADPFGMDRFTKEAPEESRKYLALLKGKRDLYRGHSYWTNLCYSNPEVRSIMADAVVEYAKKHTNVDYLHVWLADLDKNHCECEDCIQKRPSDWYMLIMNEIDEKLTKEGLDTRIVFIAYVDTQFAPVEFTITNPKRFSLLYAPISRSYCSSIHENSILPEPAPFVYNNWKTPQTAEESMALFRQWQEVWKGPAFSYEYHFWTRQCRDVGGIYIARRIYEDIQGLSFCGLDGFVEDGSQRSFFPNGFAIYVYAETLLNKSVTWEELKEDYFSHIYGKDWEKVYDLLERISTAFDYAFMSGKKSADETVSKYYDPERISRLDAVYDLTAEERALAAKQPMEKPSRAQTVSWRLLELHSQYAELIAEVMKAKAKGQDYRAVELAKHFADTFGKHEIEIQRYYDHYLATDTLRQINSKMRGTQFY